MYYAGPSHWVSSPRAAVDLKTIEQATEVGHHADADPLEIYVTYEGTEYELVLPLSRQLA